MTLTRGASGSLVSDMQALLKKQGYPINTVDGDFGKATEAALKLFQLAQGLKADGVYGPVTKARLVNAEEVSSPVKEQRSEIPWYDWFDSKMGWSEANAKQNSILSRGWKYVRLAYTSITGKSNAWCAMSLASALTETGYSIKGVTAAAKSFDNYGVPSELVKGAIITLRHKNGGRHVTVLSKVVSKSPLILDCLGGNQANKIKISRYNCSGGSHDTLVSCRWPVKV